MGYTIMAYAAEGYQEFILPELVDSDYEILLEKRTFGLQDDLKLSLEIMDGIWRFLPQKEYQLHTYDGKDGFMTPLDDGMVLEIMGITHIGITLVVLYSKDSYAMFQKYSLLQIHQITIGKENNNTIVYDFGGFISRNHAVFYQYDGRWVVQDNSSNGTYRNGRKVNGQEYLEFGDQITLFGLRMIFLGEYLAICALSGEYVINGSELSIYHPRQSLYLQEPESIESTNGYFKRSPRVVEEPYTETIEIEAPPALNKTKKRPLLLTIGPSLTMAIPMMLGCLMAIMSAKSRGGSGGIYMFTGVVTAISSAIIGVIWALTNLRYASQEEEENEELRYNAYGQYLIDVTNFIKEKYDANRDCMFRAYLSGKECCEFSGYDPRLWNHNERQSDFMAVRIGLGTVPFQAEIHVPKEKFTLVKDDLTEKPMMIRDNYKYLYSVPVCMDIRNKGLIGIVGGRDKTGCYAVAYNMIAQIAANNCYTEVKMGFIYRGDTESNKRWNFAKWLPHVWMEGRKTRLIASDKSQVGDIFYELSGVIRMRTEEQQEKKEYPLPHYVLFIDDADLLEGELLENYIYNPKAEYGITTILLAEKYEDLPNSCENIIQNDGSKAQIFNVFNESERSRDLEIETVTEEQLELLASRLCDVEVKEIEGNGEIPNSLNFFEMYGVHSLEQFNVLERWKKNRNYENMRVPIGQKSGGKLCYLDIHEKYHGPHGLVAGTTGSGKSETLQTYMLSLALNFSPDDIAFFIIDFKGGGMANLFTHLPHMAGQISNLSGNQVRRAMISIKSENKRRQRVFAENGVNNINAYTRLYKNHEAEMPIPHLFIIIDEFAELKREEPEFMKESISVAQVGRSLGVHLILATQKPSGTVDDNIWSNSKFRLCLRVQDKQDSNDMLHKPDAAYITQAGRGYLQVGNDEIYEQFQSGYSGAEYVDDPALNRTAVAIMLSLTGKQTYASSGQQRKKDTVTNAQSQLDAVIDYLGRIADTYHYDRRMMLWLPVLPEKLYLNELEGYSNQLYEGGTWPVHSKAWTLETQIGLYDDPENQAQKSVVISFSEAGHLAVCGTVTSGKSTFMQTLLYGLIHKYSPQELNFYVLDYSSRMLLPYENAPHCGGVIIDTDVDKVNKFFYMINRMMDERKNLFRGGNYSQYIQANKTNKERSMPAILIVIDNYSNFREKTNGKYDDAMLRLSREGVGYGVFLAVTAGGFGANEIPTRIADNIKTVISLEMGDKFKYAEIMHTTRIEIMPETDVKGRGLTYIHGNILEFQTALAFEAEDAYQMSEQIEAKCSEMCENWSGPKARRIPVIPEHPIFRDLTELEEYRESLANRRYLPFGYASQDASVYSVDLWHTYCYMIQGKERSGKKNVMKMLLYAAAKKENAKACVIDLSGQEFKTASEQLGVQYIDKEQEVYEFFRSTIPVFKERNLKKRDLLAGGMDDEELAETMSREEQIYIFVPDLVSFIKSVYKPAEGVGSIFAYLENITQKGSNHGFYFFGIINPEQISAVAGYTLYVNMASYKSGIHLGGNLSGQRLFQFSNIPFQEQSKPLKPGVGYVSSVEDMSIAENVVLPLVKGGLV